MSSKGLEPRVSKDSGKKMLDTKAPGQAESCTSALSVSPPEPVTATSIDAGAMQVPTKDTGSDTT